MTHNAGEEVRIRVSQSHTWRVRGKSQKAVEDVASYPLTIGDRAKTIHLKVIAGIDGCRYKKGNLSEKQTTKFNNRPKDC